MKVAASRTEPARASRESTAAVVDVDAALRDACARRLQLAHLLERHGNDAGVSLLLEHLEGGGR